MTWRSWSAALGAAAISNLLLFAPLPLEVQAVAMIVLSALLVVITSAGIYEARYILPVWPAAAIHIAAIPHYVLQWYFARRHAKQK